MEGAAGFYNQGERGLLDAWARAARATAVAFTVRLAIVAL